MTELLPLYYRQAQTIIEFNARKQAMNDAMTSPLLKVMEHVNNPSVILDAIESLQEWVRLGNTKILFTGLNKEYYDDLSPDDILELSYYWCLIYPPAVIEFMKKRLAGELT